MITFQMNSEQTATPPSVSWAQRNSCVLLTFNVECEKPEIKFDSRKVYFKGICSPDQKLHEIEIPLYAEIDPEKSKYLNKGRFIDVALVKLKTDDPFWPTLTGDKKKHHWLKVDFERWQDEDESGDDYDMNDMFSDKIRDFDDENEKDESSSEGEDFLPDTQ
ncbi:unnamed protein product [Diatraea saccharalis]|uniref:CS domain-containing protein n=1 Tax=Diatraea saccharalis TaxID=40085 RepID=A0A9N9W6A5_9NEOP|nr:unnamed protein product [Diatraea saccharalis]